MAIPKYHEFFLPILKLAADDKEHSLREAVRHIIQQFRLTEEEQSQLLPSGRSPVVYSRVSWSITYLRKAGLLQATRRGHFKITKRGQELLQTTPSEMSLKDLEQYDEFIEFKKRSNSTSKDDAGVSSQSDGDINPEELLERAHVQLRNDLADEIIKQIKNCSPEFFEQLVIDLLLAMGYGGSRKEAGRAVGKSRDGGIDGIINEDKLGLDTIYIQAKRWEGTVGRPEIQKFAGALMGKQAKRGIFITTSQFSRDAEEYPQTVDSKIILIDGERLCELMIDYNVGLSVVAQYEVKKIDLDYFEE